MRTKHTIQNSIPSILEEIYSKNVGYVARTLVQTSLPYKDHKTNEFLRINGDFKLQMIAPESIGLPYGSIPRIILAWITTEAVRTKNKRIYLGKNLSNFMDTLRYTETGGEKGDITRIKKQLTRLINTHITISYEGKNVKYIRNIQSISQSISLWVPGSSQAASAWKTDLILNQDFFEEIMSNPVPIDFNAIHALRASPLAIDIYCWATYRSFSLKNDIFIPWDKLMLQFGMGYSNDKSGKYAFKKCFIAQLENVCSIYNDLIVNIEQEGLLLKKSPTHIK